VTPMCKNRGVPVSSLARYYPSCSFNCTALYIHSCVNLYHMFLLKAQNARPISRSPCPNGWPERRPLGQEPAAARHGDRGAILVGVAVSSPGLQRIIAQMLRACGIQTDKSQHYVVPAVLQYFCSHVSFGDVVLDKRTVINTFYGLVNSLDSPMSSPD
jgi:hypothetical protein